MTATFVEQIQAARQGTHENAQITADVLEIAGAWERGLLPVQSVRRQCSGYDRFVAVNHTQGADRALLMRLLDALIEGGDGIETKHGRITAQDLTEHGGRLTEDDFGRPIVQFPTWSKELGMHMRVIPEHVLKGGGQ